LDATRIVLIDMSPLLRDIIRKAVAPEPDLDVVAEHGVGVDIREAVEQSHANFVVVGSDAAAEGYVRSLIGSSCGVRALEVCSDGRESVLYELRPHRVSLGEISPDTLVRTIRAVPGWEP
jgi:DNA-binding NarL/FixJ family response regulator